MKRKNRSMAMLWPLPKPFASGLSRVVWVAMAMMIGLEAHGQFHKPSKISRSVGDTLPESFFETVHQAVDARTGERKSIRLADYRDKLIILDFWATWCKPCIGSLNKLDSIRRGMDTTGFVVIPVTYQSAEEAAPAFDKFGWGLTSIVADTTLGRIFPHGGIPHMIWIRDGTVLANPAHYLVTEATIDMAVAGNGDEIRNEAKMFDFETFRLDANRGSGMLYRSSIEKGNPAYRQQRLLFKQVDGMTFLFIGNVGLIHGLYGNAYEYWISPHFGRHAKGTASGIHLEITDGLKTLLSKPSPKVSAYATPEDFQEALDSWTEGNRFTYSLAVNAPVSKDDALGLMRRDLDSFFGIALGIEAVTESRPKRLALLTTLGDPVNAEELLLSRGTGTVIDTKGGNRYGAKRAHVSSIATAIQRSGVLGDIPLVDETGLDPNLLVDFELTFPPRGSDPGTLNGQLAAYGLRLDVVERPEPVLVIREKKGRAATGSATNE